LSPFPTMQYLVYYLTHEFHTYYHHNNTPFSYRFVSDQWKDKWGVSGLFWCWLKFTSNPRISSYIPTLYKCAKIKLTENTPEKADSVQKIILNQQQQQQQQQHNQSEFSGNTKLSSTMRPHYFTFCPNQESGPHFLDQRKIWFSVPVGEEF